MDLAGLRDQARQARQFEARIDAEVSFTLQAPTRLQMQLGLIEAAGANARLDAAAKLRYLRLELMRAIVGWSGVRECHLLAGAGDAPQPFDPSLVEILLDEQPAWEDALVVALRAEQERRDAARSTAAKN